MTTHCDACGIPWAEHDGIARTCAALQSLRSAFSDEQTKRVLLASRIAAIREKIESIVSVPDGTRQSIVRLRSKWWTVQIRGVSCDTSDGNVDETDITSELNELWEMTKQ